MKSIQRLNQKFKPAKYAVLAMLALCLGGSLASAQSFKGKFTLPFEARWGLATLPPGNYSISVASDTATIPKMVVVSGGKNAMALIVPIGHSDIDTSRSSKLAAFRDRNGTYHIRSLQLGPVGTTLMFSVPRQVRPLIASAPEVVTISGNAMSK